jgi:hypothetical protein
MTLTLDGLIRALRWRMHALAEEPRAAYDPRTPAGPSERTMARTKDRDRERTVRHDRRSR